MFLKILKDKRFWLVWLTLSIVGGIAAYFIVKSKDSQLVSENIQYAFEYRDNLKHSSIIAVQSVNDTANYIRYFKNETKIVDFRFTTIPEGKKLYVLNFNEKRTLAKIAVKSSSTDRVNGTYSEYWIWYKFLSQVKK